MTEKTPSSDYDALAKRYLDLWQDQMAKLAKDPSQLTDTAAAWSQMAASMMQNAASSASAKSAHDPNAKPSATASSKPTSDKTGPASTGAVYGDGKLDLADVLRRLDALEQRLANLESAASTPVDGELSKPASRRSGASQRKKSGEP